jgi:hypothetical protein
MDEMLEKIQWVKDNFILASRIAKSAQALVLKRHTYRHLAQRVLLDTQNSAIK